LNPGAVLSSQKPFHTVIADPRIFTPGQRGNLAMTSGEQMLNHHAHARCTVDIHVWDIPIGIGPSECDEGEVALLQQFNARVIIFNARQDKAIYPVGVYQFPIFLNPLLSLAVRKGQHMITGVFSC
jgi:hypothetical protein